MTSPLLALALGALLLAAVPAGGARAAATGDPLDPRKRPPARPLAYLKASEPDISDFFGRGLAVSGGTVLVGAILEDSAATGIDGDETDDSATSAGAAYVLALESGRWTRQAYLKASNTEALDNFGISVDVEGDTAVVGAYAEDSAATGVGGDEGNHFLGRNSGAAYVFVREGGTWRQAAYLKASNTGAGDRFGTSVALSGDTIVVGAYEESSAARGVDGDQADDSLPQAGAAYVFVRQGATWRQEAYLKASNTRQTQRFGWSVDVDGDTIVVGAESESGGATGVDGDATDLSVAASGAAYVFRRSASGWRQEAYLKASNTGLGDHFGGAVAIAGDTIVVGAEDEDGAAGGGGADNAATSAGAAYVFRRKGATWSPEATLKASNAETFDRFGGAVACSEGWIAVGARDEDGAGVGLGGDPSSNTVSQSGAVYLFRRADEGWRQVAYLKASNAEFQDGLGAEVALSGSLLLASALSEDGGAGDPLGDPSSNAVPNSGAVYAFALRGAGGIAFRGAASNPASYAASAMELGRPFTARVDNAAVGQRTSRLLAFEGAACVPLSGGQTLLAIDRGAGELFGGAGLLPSISVDGVDRYALLVPDDPSLLGLALCTQAIQLGRAPFALSNALDLTIGGP